MGRDWSKKDKAMDEDLDLDNTQEEKNTSIQDAQTSAFCAALTIIVFSAVYWAFQIQSVRELLDLAYGF